MSAEHHNTIVYHTGNNIDEVIEIHDDPKSKKAIWKTFWILLVITIFEVAIAFTSLPKELLKWTFITLTGVKAYFIVFSFMHLKHEKKFFRYAILTPFILFIGYGIAMILYEGNAVAKLTNFFATF